MDHIRINDLEVFCSHGVHEEEKKLGQKFIVSADLLIDLSDAGRNDDLGATADFGKISHLIYDHMRENSYALIEAAAENIARKILRTFKTVKSAEIEVKKPWAPIGLSLGFVSVCVKREWHDVYIGLGSNMGDKACNLDSALELLSEEPDIAMERVSSYYGSTPYGGVEQDDFLNAVARIRTLMKPEHLLFILKDIEKKLGRKDSVRWGPRTLDLDILLYDDIIMYTEDLIIPHADMHNRDFVLTPLCEIAPFVRHPIFNRRAEELLRDVREKHVVKRVELRE